MRLFGQLYHSFIVLIYSSIWKHADAILSADWLTINNRLPWNRLP